MGSHSRRPVSGVPWVAVGADAVWAWQPGHGLIKLSESILTRKPLGGSSLSPEGTILRWQTPADPRLRLVCHLRLASGAVVVTRAPDDLGEDFYGQNGMVCHVQNVDLVNGVWQHSRYSIRHDGKWRNLPHQQLLRSSPSSPGVQFSSDGSRIAATVLLADGLTTCIEVTDLSLGTARRYVRTELLGTGAWSPDGRHLLVQQYGEAFQGYHPAVLDLENGSTTLIAEVPNQDIRVAQLQLLGWIDDRRVLGWRLHERRLQIWTVDVFNGHLVRLTEMRSPVSHRDLHYLLMAPNAVQADPELLLSQPVNESSLKHHPFR